MHTISWFTTPCNYFCGCFVSSHLEGIFCDARKTSFEESSLFTVEVTSSPALVSVFMVLSIVSSSAAVFHSQTVHDFFSNRFIEAMVLSKGTQWENSQQMR